MGAEVDVDRGELEIHGSLIMCYDLVKVYPFVVVDVDLEADLGLRFGCLSVGFDIGLSEGLRFGFVLDLDAD